MKPEERGTHYYSRIIVVLAQKSENLQRMVAAKRRYIVVAFQVESHRHVDCCILASM
jgi:hypothetical protein